MLKATFKEIVASFVARIFTHLFPTQSFYVHHLKPDLLLFTRSRVNGTRHLMSDTINKARKLSSKMQGIMWQSHKESRDVLDQAPYKHQTNLMDIDPDSAK